MPLWLETLTLPLTAPTFVLPLSFSIVAVIKLEIKMSPLSDLTYPLVNVPMVMSPEVELIWFSSLTPFKLKSSMSPPKDLILTLP